MRIRLQFAWIEGNLLRFFLADVRNSRGKFDEIKGKFVINPPPIGIDHDELKIFLEIRLIHFTNRSKVKDQRREIHAFKEEFPPDFETV